MVKTSKNYLLLSLILIFSFIYRVVLMLRETFPPGADIGLHNSIIYSITQSGNTNFLYNYYHMGGGSSVTFPGYHIFVAYVIMLTGIPDYVAHALVVSLFSSLIVLVAYLITRRAWNASAALIVAFLLAVSRFDVEMLMWGGYPNVITLMLIPLAFYLFLEKDKFSLFPFLAVTSLISGAIFLTHSLSAALFVAITFFAVFFITAFSRKVGERRTTFVIWITPLIVGAILILPFLLQVVPSYLGSNADTFTGGVADIRQALLSTKILPLELVLPLFFCVFLFFLLSKRYIGKYLSIPAILLALWILVPAVLTQGYLVGLYTDYNRFMYFLILPVVMLIGMVIYHGAESVTRALNWLVSVVKDTPQVRVSKSKTLARVMLHLTRRNMLIALLTGFLLFAFLAVPIFMVPSKGIEVQSFYQVMDNPQYEAIQWAQNNTPTSSVFVTDALYGWWFGGFAKRPTISAVEPEYLTNSREFVPSTVARYLLDTDYLVDNGVIQIREDGGYIGRHNPEFLIRLNGSEPYYHYYPYPFFNFDNSQTFVMFRLRAGENSQEVHKYTLSAVPVSNMTMENNNNESVTVSVTRQNQYFNFTQKFTVLAGAQFVNMTETVMSRDPTVTFDHITFTIPTKGLFAQNGPSTVGKIDRYYNAMGQLVFTEGIPDASAPYDGPIVLDYNIGAKAEANITLSAGLYTFSPDPNLNAQSTDEEWRQFGQTLLATINVTQLSQKPLNPQLMDVFDYRLAMESQGVSYIAVRDSVQIPRFAKDPMFRLVFINNEVAIFQVQK